MHAHTPMSDIERKHKNIPLRFLAPLPCACVWQAIALFSRTAMRDMPKLPDRLPYEQIGVQRIACIKTPRDVTAGDTLNGSYHRRNPNPPLAYVTAFAWFQGQPLSQGVLLHPLELTEERMEREIREKTHPGHPIAYITNNGGMFAERAERASGDDDVLWSIAPLEVTDEMIAALPEVKQESVRTDASSDLVRKDYMLYEQYRRGILERHLCRDSCNGAGWCVDAQDLPATLMPGEGESGESPSCRCLSAMSARTHHGLLDDDRQGHGLAPLTYMRSCAHPRDDPHANPRTHAMTRMPSRPKNFASRRRIPVVSDVDAYDHWGPDLWYDSTRPSNVDRMTAWSVPMLPRCPASCSGVGACSYGFCACPSGRWGLACEFPKELDKRDVSVSSSSSSTSSSRIMRSMLRIHVIEAPALLRRACHPHQLPERFAGAVLTSDIATDNPHDADYLLVYGCPESDSLLAVLTFLLRDPAYREIAQDLNELEGAGVPSTFRPILLCSQFEGGYGNLHLALKHWLTTVPAWISRWMAPTNPRRIVANIQLSGLSDHLLPSMRDECRICFNPELDVAVPSPPGEVDGLGLIGVNGIECHANTPFSDLCIFEGNSVKRMAERWERKADNKLFFAGAIHMRSPEREIILSRTEPYAFMRDIDGGIRILQTEKLVHEHTVFPDQVDETVDGMLEMSKSDFCMVPEGKTGNFGHRDVAALFLGCTPLYTKVLTSHQFFSRAVIPWHAISASIPPHAAPEGKRLLDAAFRLYGDSAVRKEREISTMSHIWNSLTWSSLYPEMPCLESVRDPSRDAFAATLLELSRRRLEGKRKQTVERTTCIYVQGTVAATPPRLDGTGLRSDQTHPRFATLQYFLSEDDLPANVRDTRCAPYGEMPTDERPMCTACGADPFDTDSGVFYVKQCGIPAEKLDGYRREKVESETNADSDDSGAAVDVLLIVSDHNNHGLFAQVERVLNQIYVAQMYNLIPAIWLGMDAFAPIGSCEHGLNHYHPYNLGVQDANRQPNLWPMLFERLSSYDPLDTHVLTPNGYRRVRNVHVASYKDILEVKTPFAQPPPCSVYHDENGGDFERRNAIRASCSWVLFSSLRVRDVVMRRVVSELREWKSRNIKRVLGVHLRGTDKAVRPRVELRRFRTLVDAWLENMKSTGEDDYGVFLATEDHDYWLEASKWLGPRLVNPKRTLPHTANAVRDLSMPNKAHDALVDALLLAHTDFLLMSTSGVPEFAIWHNPKLHFASIDLQLPEGRELEVMGIEHVKHLPPWAIEALGGEPKSIHGEEIDGDVNSDVVPDHAMSLTNSANKIKELLKVTDKDAAMPSTISTPNENEESSDEPDDNPPPQLLPSCAHGMLLHDDELQIPLPDDASVTCSYPRDASLYFNLRRCPYGYISSSFGQLGDGESLECNIRLDSSLDYLPDPHTYLTHFKNDHMRRCQSFFFELLSEATRLRLATYQRTSVRVSDWPPTAPGKAVLRYLLIAYGNFVHHAKFAEVPPLEPWKWAANLTDCDSDATGEMRPSSDGNGAASRGWSCLHEVALPHDWRLRSSADRRRRRWEVSESLGEEKANEALCYAHRAIATVAATHKQAEEDTNLSPYLIAGILTDVLIRPSVLIRRFLRERTRHVNYRAEDDMPDAPVVALHVRRGDACDRGEENLATDRGPRGHLHTGGVRMSPRRCYAWSVYEAALRKLQARYGVRRVLLATDSPTVLDEATKVSDFDWTFVEFDRSQLNFHPEGRSTPEWVEIRSDGRIGSEEILSAFAEIHLLGTADIFVGTLSSNFGRLAYHLMMARARSNTLPPFITVDGYPLCCDLTQYCETAEAVEARQTSWAPCVYGISASFPLNRTKVPGQVHD